MTTRSWLLMIAAAIILMTGTDAAAQQAGSIRGVAYDADFEEPLALAQVTIVETGETTTATEEGNYVFPSVPPGTYTLVFSKEGYARQVRSDVVVSPGQLTDVDVWLSGEFLEMEEFIVEDLVIGGATEQGLIDIRLQAADIQDSISAELMSQAGASDVGAALNFVSGATVEDGKYAVIRGLPDRYVVSMLNGVRLPTADEDKRAAELDQYPSTVVESVRISKTFTPDQQGDASGGAVNIVLKGIPRETIFKVKGQVGYNSQAANRSDFPTYEGGGLNYWGRDNGRRNIQDELLGEIWEGAVGVSTGDAPIDHKWSVDIGGRHEFEGGATIGGFATLFYERDSQFIEDGVEDSYWVTEPGGPMVPETTQGAPTPGEPQTGDFKTSLFDVTQGTQSVQWGALMTGGFETENHQLGVTYLYTRTAEDKATLAEDTRGKAHFFPDYDPDDPNAVGNSADSRDAAPYLRTHTLEYTERTTRTLIFNGRHTFPTDDIGIDDFLVFHDPEVTWAVSQSSAELYQPDKRQFGVEWRAEYFSPGVPPFIPPSIRPATYRPYKPSANFTLGNLQRIWKEIEEESKQQQISLKLPFDQWSDVEGYLKFGLFNDETTRRFNQDTFSNFNDNSSYQAQFDEPWADVFPEQDNHPITDGPPFVDVDYRGEQNIQAWYAMADIPLFEGLNVIGGARFESTEISIVNDPEVDAKWFPEGTTAPVALNPGDADVDFEQDDVLPAISVVYSPIETLTFRGSYTETIARQTFKELTPIIQQEFLGGPVFIGNPALQMSSLQNFDLRADYRPLPGGLISASWFRKDIEDPIEYVQRVANFTFTTPVNYPEGELTGVELEIRQDLGAFWEPLAGLTLGGNATFIDSEVTLPEDEAEQFNDPAILAPITSRDMTNAPEHLYNLYLIYDVEVTGTQVGVFYTVRGDTLIAGAAVSDGNFVPSVYETEYATLNFTLSQKLGDIFTLSFSAKNLTNPRFEEVYRSPYIGGDVLKSSYSKGIDYAISLSAEFTF